MAQTILNNSMIASVFRVALNAMFGELYPKTAQTAPTTATVGYIGQTIITTTGVHYQCMAESGGVYTWLQRYPKPVSIFKLSADQTTGNSGAAIAAGDRIKFNTTTVNDIAGCVLDTSTNVGSITLPAGKYQLYWGVKCAFGATTGIATGTIYETGGAALSAFSSGKLALTWAGSNTGDYPPVPAYLNLAAETDIEIQLSSAAQVSSIQAIATHIIIERIG